MGKAEIIFVQPYLNQQANIPGFGFLRGFLEKNGYATKVVNFGRMVSKNKKSGKEVKKLRSFLIGEIGKKAADFDGDDIFGLMGYFVHLFPERIWEAVGLIGFFSKTYDDFFGKRRPADYLGLSVSSLDQILFVLGFAAFAKKKWGSRIKIVCGGPGVTRNHEDLVAVLKTNPVVDYLILGEGETPLWELLERKKPLKKIPNLIFLESGRYKKAEDMLHFENINELPAPLFDPGDTAFIRATRRCYWSKCAFCVMNDNSFCRTGFIRKVEDVMGDIREIQARSGIRHFRFVDSAMPVPFLRNFSEKAVQESVRASFSTFLRFDPKLDFETLKKAKAAGFDYFSFGLESSVPRLLKLISKGIDPKIALKTIKMCDRLGITAGVHFIIGLPTQTEAELKKDLNFLSMLIEKFDNVRPMVASFRLEPNSPIFNDPGRFGLKLGKKMGPFVSDYRFEGLNKNQITNARALQVYRRFYEENEAKLREWEWLKMPLRFSFLYNESDGSA